MTGNNAKRANKRSIAMVVTIAVARRSRGCIAAKNYSFVLFMIRRPNGCRIRARPGDNALIQQCFENDSQAEYFPGRLWFGVRNSGRLAFAPGLCAAPERRRILAGCPALTAKPLYEIHRHSRRANS
jgi:hypothetical protein